MLMSGFREIMSEIINYLVLDEVEGGQDIDVRLLVVVGTIT